jgi:hypothetical protein
VFELLTAVVELIDATTQAMARGDQERQAELGGANQTGDLVATMDADLDLLGISVDCTADASLSS